MNHSLFVCLIILSTTILAMMMSVAATPTRPSIEAIDSWPQYQLVTNLPLTPTDISGFSVITPPNNNKPVDHTILVEGKFAPKMMEVGWHFLQVDTTGLSSWVDPVNKSTEFYLAGFFEGYLTYKPIQDKNTSTAWKTNMNGSTELETWMNDHISYMQEQSHEHAHVDKYWEQVGAILKQIQGVADGYNFRAAEEKSTDRITFKDVFAQSFQEEFYDVNAHLKQAKSKFSGGVQVGGLKPSHCSAVVSAYPRDVILSHVSWNIIESALRIYKIYDFRDVSVSFSSYPAVLFSLDDFYETSKGLAIFETSLVVWNNTMYNDFPSTVVSEFIRVMVASYMTSDCKTWPQVFIKENSGTYNNDYFCLDHKQVAASKPDGSESLSYLSNLPAFTVSVVSQLPGFYCLGDATNDLKKNGFISSYNVPFHKACYDVSGQAQQAQPFWGFNYMESEYARPVIFRNLAPKIRSMEDVQHLMRWNKFQTSEWSAIATHGGTCEGCPNGECNPTTSAMLAISCRGDLNPVGFRYNYGPAFDFLNQRDHFGIDAKISSFSSWEASIASSDNKTEVRSFPKNALIISGPSNDDQPSFSFTKAPYANWKWRNNSPPGMPDLWDFPWVQLAPTKSQAVVYPSGSSAADDDSNKTGEALGAIFGAVGALSLVIVVFFFFRSKKQLDQEEEAAKNRAGLNTNTGAQYEAVQ